LENKGWYFLGFVALIVLLIWANVITIPNINLPSNVGPVTVVQPTTVVQVPAGGFRPGDFDMDIAAFDSFVPGTTYTVTDVSSTTWYKNVGGVYTTLGSGDTTIVVEADTEGYIYAAVTGAANYYIDAWKMKASDSKIQSMSYFDIDGQSPKEFVFKISLQSITRGEGYTPKVTFNLWILPYEAPTVSTVSDTVTTCGTSAVDEYFEFYTQQTTLNRAYAIYKVDFSILKQSGSYSPQTDSAKFVYMKVNIPGKGYVDITSSMQLRTNDLYYSYSLGTDMGDAYYVKTSQNDLNKQYYTLNARVDFDSGDANYEIAWTLYYLVPTAGGNHSAATTTDSVYVSD
jgi:hypothetical protein